MNKTRKTKLWSKYTPNSRERTIMMKKCGKKCFLGPKKSYPICKKNTCKVSSKGVYSAYIRASQYHMKKISRKAKKLLVKMGVKR
mgnify:CR=1 FL=1